MNFIFILLIGFLAVINVLGIFLMGYDKASARSNQGGERRVAESTLLFIAIIGGSLGIFIGMFLFRHKTQKPLFLVGIPLLLLQQFFFLKIYFPLLSAI